MTFEDDAKQDLVNHKRDITSLYSRLGLDAATYREFEVTRDDKSVGEAIGPVSLPSSRSAAMANVEPLRSSRNATVASLQTERRVPRQPRQESTSFAQLQPRTSAATRIAFFSLSGGVGKTTLAVNAARALSSNGHDVVIVNCGQPFALDGYVRPRTSRAQFLSFLHGTADSAGHPVTVLHAPASELGTNTNGTPTAIFFEQATSSSDFLLFDLPVVLDGPAREILGTVDHIVVPLLPDLASAASVGLFEPLLSVPGRLSPRISFVFNRVDPSRSLHRDIRARVEKLVGARLLPFVVEQDTCVEEAAAHALAVVDREPQAAVAGQLNKLADWIASLDSETSAGSVNIAARGRA